MKKSIIEIFLQIVLCSSMNFSLFAQNHSIYVGQVLSPGYDMGVNSSNNLTNWLSDSLGYMKMVYPAGQVWGAVFITVGQPVNPPRPFKNYSMYKSMQIEMKGGSGGETIDIGIKDNTDPDNGQETKIAILLTKEWKIYEFSLIKFVTADLSHLYAPVEFVFGGNQSKTVYFKNINYKK
jgi:hypothetical protein